MQSLREQSEESFDVVRKARLELPIVDELKSVVDESMKRTSFTPNGVSSLHLVRIRRANWRGWHIPADSGVEGYS